MSVAPSPASVGSCADALAVASSAIAWTCRLAQEHSRCVGGLAGAMAHHKVKQASAENRHNCATSDCSQDWIAVVKEVNECGDGGDAMGSSSRLNFAMLSNAQP